MQKTEISVARLRARILWLAAQQRFAKGAQNVRFKRSDFIRMLELDPVSDSDPFGGIAAVIAAMPSAGQPTWDGDEFTMADPDTRRKVQDETEVVRVLNYWRDKTGRTGRTLYTSARLSIVRSRLREGYSVEQLCAAVDSMVASEFHVTNGYTDTAHAFRPDRLERWIAETKDASQEAITNAARETARRRRR